MNNIEDIINMGSNFFDIAVVAFVFSIGLFFAALMFMYAIDRFQTKHTIRRNYPVIGRFRYYFEHLGGFFRQYFFAMDREELPFNRADRSWVYRAAKNIDRTIAFGSTRNLSPSGEIIFLNSLFPVQENSLSDTDPDRDTLMIGEHYVPQPYAAKSIFNISGMSYGAISKPAIKALATGAKKANVWMNTGEGGVSAYHLRSGCDLVMQIGTAKYGVRDEEGKLSIEKIKRLAQIEQIKMFEIKLSQGAKPGKGGMLPAEKVTPEIAEIRSIPVGKASNSPNAHEDIHSVSDLLNMIQTVRDAAEKPVGIKFVLGDYSWLDKFCNEILHRGIQSAPDFITLDGGEGGTGASPQTLMDYAGLPLHRSLPLIVDKLSEYGLKERIKIVASGKLMTPSSIAWALCIGADFIVSARGFMFSIGCIQALQCNKNTCPTGITTHNLKLQRGLNWQEKSERAYFYIINMEKELEMLAHSCGVESPRQLSRKHAHIITDRLNTMPMDELYPEAPFRPELIKVHQQNDDQ